MQRSDTADKPLEELRLNALPNDRHGGLKVVEGHLT